MRSSLASLTHAPPRLILSRCFSLQIQKECAFSWIRIWHSQFLSRPLPGVVLSFLRVSPSATPSIHMLYVNNPRLLSLNAHMGMDNHTCQSPQYLLLYNVTNICILNRAGTRRNWPDTSHPLPRLRDGRHVDLSALGRCGRLLQS